MPLWRIVSVLEHFYFFLLPASSPTTWGLVVVYLELWYLLLNSLPFLHQVNNFIQFLAIGITQKKLDRHGKWKVIRKPSLTFTQLLAISFPAKAKATFYQVRSKILKTQYVGDFGVENMTYVFQQKIKILAKHQQY